MQDPWHIDIMRNDLPKKLPILFPSLLDEVSITCQDILPAVHSTGKPLAFASTLSLIGPFVSSAEWTPLNATDLGLELVWRASQRILLGPPMCRDREWKSLTVSFTRNWVIGSQLLRLLPGFLRGYVGSCCPCSWIAQDNAHAGWLPNTSTRCPARCVAPPRFSAPSLKIIGIGSKPRKNCQKPSFLGWFGTTEATRGAPR